jgi:hypothetical protein
MIKIATKIPFILCFKLLGISLVESRNAPSATLKPMANSLKWIEVKPELPTQS